MLNNYKIKMNIPACILMMLLFASFTYAQSKGLDDRAFATHNINQVGFFTTNIGQFYPYGGQFERTLEYPINSGHICMYRQCIMIGVPVNVISAADGRFEEFDAIGSYNAGTGEIAISDNLLTWPDYGWPIQDEHGNPEFLGTAQQESYCVYSDSTNWRYKNNGEDDALLDIRVHQSISTWAVEDHDKYHIINFRLENVSNREYEDMYFNFYSDLDIGGNGNAENEWADDCIAFDKERELVYFYDSDSYSDEWGEADPFMSGVTFLQTPNNLGITDFHWIDVYTDEVAVNNADWDSVSYNLMRSDTSWFHNRYATHGDFPVSDYFHLGDNPINGTHYDDPATTRITDGEGNVVGGPMVAYICNGPFNIPAGESVEIMVGVMVGDNNADILKVTDTIRNRYPDFNIPVVPKPVIAGVSGDNSVELSWSNELDISYENAATQENDLEGYIIYRTIDQDIDENSWTVLDTLPMEYDENSALNEAAYSYSDNSQVFNGFNYIYCLTVYRTNLAGSIEESPKLASIDNLEIQENAVMVEPTNAPAMSKKDIKDVKVVPNPFVVAARWDEERLGGNQFGEPVRNLAFINLPAECTIRIFTVDGDLINTIEHRSGSGREEWNLFSSEKRPVTTGVYFYHVKSRLGEKTGRFAVIR